MIQLNCACGKTIKVKSEHAGKRLKCPACQTILTVPDEESEASESPATANAASTKPRSKSSKTTKPRTRTTRKPSPVEEEIEDIDYGDDQDAYDSGSEFDDDFGTDDYQPSALPTRRKKKGKSKKSGSGKKKKSGADAQDAISPKVMYSLFGLAGTVSAVVMFFIVRSIMASAAAEAGANALPDKFAVYKHEQVSLASEYPDAKGWTKASGGGTGGVPPWIRYKNEKQGISINIRGSVSGTAISDIATAGGGIVNLDELPDELHPAAAVHKYQHDKISADYNKYEETEPKKIETGFGEGRVSDFTGSSVLSSEYGMRASLIANQYQYNVICKVPKKRLEEYRPVFERIIKSVGGG